MMRPVLLAVFVLFSFAAGAQSDSTRTGGYGKYQSETEDPVFFWDKCYTGGDLMVFGGAGQFYFNISPLLGYRPQNKGFSYGVGLTYQYTSFVDPYSRYSYSLFGMRAFLRQQLGQHFFIHGEYENYFTRGENIFTRKMETIIVPCANAFLGYKQNFSEFSYYYIMLGYEFIGDRNARQYVYTTHPIVFKIGYIFDIRGK